LHANPDFIEILSSHSELCKMQSAQRNKVGVWIAQVYSKSVYVPQCKLRLLVWKEEYYTPIVGHEGEKTKITPHNGVNEILLVMYKRRYNPFCEGLGGCQMNQTSY
jgi:hypothetical protein